MGIWRWRILLGVATGWLAMAAGAQSLEGVLMPGKVIAGHVKVEEQCEKCHVKFDKTAQDRLCLDCHKEVARDLREKHGLHGRLAPQACRTCHTDHKGREMNIAPIEEKGFDHAKTGFALNGAHAREACRSCHVTGKKYREAPVSCDGCHRKDDKHKGGLGPQCQDCHKETQWKDTTRFDHAKTKFALTGKHVDTKCVSCHINDRFKEAPQTCVGCHRKDDKQHHGRLGEKCETCHVASNWKDVTTFSHDRDTHFMLRGKHRTAKCETCHKSTAGLIKLPGTCIGCHEADDKHNATLGTACGDCHTEQSWREAKYNHDLSKFRLLGKHRDVECKQCHRNPTSFRGAPLECVACHRKDDTHKGRYGELCGTCHTAVTWKDIVFRHDRDTKYRLIGRHVTTKCDACHVGNVYKDKLTTDCYSCHKKDDKHRDQLGRQCEQCHDTEDWKKTVRFDHAKSRFPLLGIHLRTECKSCHVTPAFKDAKRECAACHVKDDRHKGKLGADCGTCHSARAWKLWDFDHDRRTRYPLEGAHAKVQCVACHKVPGDKIPALATYCVSCHAVDDVHGGSFGGQCERCHTPRSFKDIKAFGRASSRAGPENILPGTGTRQ
jgi:hypothetical protein